jgi:succinate-semialdehyde dehydrogenase/glutarate-semialdehyde dehydrogenase
MATTAAPDRLVSVNPATQEPVGAVVRTQPSDLPSRVAAARAAQEQWAARSLLDRAGVLREAVRVIRVHADEIAETVVAETAKPRTEAISNELLPALDQAAWLARNAPSVLAEERVSFSQLHLKAKKGTLIYEPLGVVGAITPWNIPFAIPFGVVAAAVAAGNGVVLKPSELAPLTAEWVVRVLDEAGVPPGLVQLAQGEREVGEALVADPGIAKVFFTGSVAVGRRVAAAAGARGCPVVLELGGKDPLVVFADADLDRAVDGALFASFLNAGQACVSAERIYVERPAYDEFRRKLEERAKSIELAPMVMTGEHRRPEIVDGPLPDEEIFGPTASIEPFDGEDEAVRLANDTSFGLAASVWTRDVRKGERVARRIEAGMVWMNDFGYSFGTGQVPWGGVKASGFGRTSGKHGLYEQVQVRYLDVDRGRMRPGWWFPYDAKTEQALRATVDVLYGDGLERWRAAWRNRRALVHLVKRSR